MTKAILTHFNGFNHPPYQGGANSIVTSLSVQPTKQFVGFLLRLFGMLFCGFLGELIACFNFIGHGYHRCDCLNDGKLRYSNNPDLSVIPAPDAVIRDCR